MFNPYLINSLFILGGYLLGSLSAAIIVCKLMRLPDPRATGSKNPGATNVLRIGGKLPAVLTLFGDAIKGFIPVAVGEIFGLPPVILACIALAAFLGHVFPIFFRFDGGKGVATAAGAIAALSPPLILISLITWLVIMLFSKTSSLSALVTATLAPLNLFLLGDTAFIIPITVMILIILWRHKENIIRLRLGTEPQVGKK